MDKIQITAEPGSLQIIITREFDAPRDLVFRAWTDPQLISQWLGPRRLRMEIERYDVRDGGSYRYFHLEPDGTRHGFHGVFHGNPSPDGFVQTFEYEGAPGYVSMDTLHLEEVDGRTVAHINSVHQTVEARDAMLAAGMEAGLSEGFERLDALLAQLAAPVA